jgi:hypothetical protein
MNADKAQAPVQKLDRMADSLTEAPAAVARSSQCWSSRVKD